MNMTLKNNRHWIGRTAAAVAVTAALTLGSAPAALADIRTVTGTVSTQAVSEIDANRVVNLTLIKTKTNPLDGGASVEGITFTVRRINDVDLTTDEGWELARNMTVDEAKARGLGPAHTAVTDSEGVASIYNLPIGLYLVSESGNSPEFLITLPTGNTDGTAWDYAVTVRTKANGLIVIPIPVPIPGGGSSTPGQTPVPDQPPATEQPPVETDAPERGTPRKGLPMTGANVVWLVAAGIFLIGGGTFLIRRRHRA